jgi:thiamine-phosphate pyrophosphorylase
MSPPRAARALRGLYVITPEDADGARLADRIRRAIAGGACLVQYRAKRLSARAQAAQAAALLEICRASGVPLIVNDSVDLAERIGADGVHLGRDDGDTRAARERLGDRLIGVSCYDDLARVRAAADADYFALGSVFPSSTKPGAVRAPLALLAAAKRIAGRPIVAIGGITADNARQAIDAGADMVAVISAVFDTPDVESAARSIARLFDMPERTADARAQPRAL